MSVNGYIACSLLVLAITVNCLTVYLQKKHQIYDRFGDNAHKIHSLVIAFFWLAFIAFYMYFESQLTGATTFKSPILGYSLKLISLIIFYLSIKQIGSGALTNKDLFSGEWKKLSGVYKYVNEPIYTSYTLFILGSAFVNGVDAFYYMSLISLVGLQIIEATIENTKN